MLGCLRGEERILLGLLLRRAVEEGVQYDGGDRGQNDAVTENRLQHVGKHPEERRRHDGDQPEADRDRDDQDAVAVLHIVHRRQNLDAGRAATMPNMMKPAPPSTHCGTEATMNASFGIRPSTSMMPPPATQTQRLYTPVTPT